MNLQDSPITEDDFHAVVRILGEISSMDGTPDEKRRHLMTELCRIIGADSWFWGISPFMQPGRQPVHLLEDGSAVIAFYREASAPLFTPRETRIAHIVLTEIQWLHDEGGSFSEAKPATTLPPRCRLILHQLLAGRSRKGIAADLGISIHTVNDYLKQIFRHFDVHSHVQLIARLRTGDGNEA